MIRKRHELENIAFVRNFCYDTSAGNPLWDRSVHASDLVFF
jgi:hypothetical protein